MEGVKVKTVLVEDFKAHHKSRDLEWYADEPIEQGGQNTGPKPTEMLLASLTGCKVITAKMYANRKGWKIDSIAINLEIIEKGERLKIAKSVAIEGELDEAQKQRIVDITSRCPVAKSLSNSIEFILG